MLSPELVGYTTDTLTLPLRISKNMKKVMVKTNCTLGPLSHFIKLAPQEEMEAQLRTCIMHFFQVYGVKNAPKFLLQKWTSNDLKIIKKNNKMHSPGSYRPPREPQSTPTQNCEMSINHKQRTS